MYGKRKLIFLAFAALIGNTSSLSAQQSAIEKAPSQEELIARVSQSIVVVITGKGGEVPDTLGSGIIVTSDGAILTAYHVVKDAREVQIRLKNGEVYDRVELIGVDERRDIAALRVTAQRLPALPVASGEEIKPGEPVYVVSNPQGLGWSASSGIFSAWRLAEDVEGAGSGYRLLQFTAAVSPGSSGGALVNGKGEVAGIVLASKAGQNLNFAIPAASVMGLAMSTKGTAYAPGGKLRISKTEETTVSPAEIRVAPVEPAVSGLRKGNRIFLREKEGGAFSGFPADPLTKKLLENTKFKDLDFLIVDSPSGADYIIALNRPAMSWDCTYTLTDTRTGALVGSGKVIAWDCIRAAPGVAKQIIKDLERLRSSQPQTAPAQEKKKQ